MPDHQLLLPTLAFLSLGVFYSQIRKSLSDRRHVLERDIASKLGVIPHVRQISPNNIINILILIQPEGGYFVETYRSGSQPMASKGQTDISGETIPSKRVGSARNVMTSIIFMATSDAPILYFGINKSDHVHYYHGGDSYTYIVVEENGNVYEVTLGPNVLDGDQLQIIFPSGCMKAGHLNGKHCILGEGVAPGFDFRDFTFVDEDLLEKRVSPQNFEKYVKYIKPDRRRNFDDYYKKSSN